MNQKILDVMAFLMSIGYHVLPATSPKHIRFALLNGEYYTNEIQIDINNPILPEQFRDTGDETSPKQKCELAQPNFD
jgi:hypothetical protein